MDFYEYDEDVTAKLNKLSVLEERRRRQLVPTAPANMSHPPPPASLVSCVKTQTWASPMLIVQLTIYFPVRNVQLGRSVSFSSVSLWWLLTERRTCDQSVQVAQAAPNCAALPLKKGKASLRSRRPLFITLHRSPLNGEIDDN